MADDNNNPGYHPSSSSSNHQTNSSTMNALEFEGSNCFRQRLVLATLTGKRIVINKFRDKVGTTEIGIQKHEICLLRLLEKLTNGSHVVIDENGTRITYKPGTLSGGEVDHFCGAQRSIGYFLEVLLPLAPYCKVPLEANLKGVTNDQLDPTVDALRHSALPIIRSFLGTADEEELQLKVISRGLKPAGGGHVLFKCPIRRILKPIQWLQPGKVKRIRGVAFATRVSPAMANRMVDTAKGILLNYIPDIYIYTDHLKGVHSGRSPGFGLSLVAETNEGCFYIGEAMSIPANDRHEVSIPEDVAQQAAYSLLNDIYRGGTVSTINQGLAAIFMTFGDYDLSKVVWGPLSPYTIELLRHIRRFTSAQFKLDPLDKDEDFNHEIDDDDDEGEKLKNGSRKIVAAVIGIGYTNKNKTIR